MTLRRSVDLYAPGREPAVEQSSSPRLRRFPIVIDPCAVFAMKRRQEAITLEKAVARHARHAGRR